MNFEGTQTFSPQQLASAKVFPIDHKGYGNSQDGCGWWEGHCCGQEVFLEAAGLQRGLQERARFEETLTRSGSSADICWTNLRIRHNYYFHFTSKKMEGQRSLVTCAGSLSKELAALEFKWGSVSDVGGWYSKMKKDGPFQGSRNQGATDFFKDSDTMKAMFVLYTWGTDVEGKILAPEGSVRKLWHQCKDED